MLTATVNFAVWDTVGMRWGGDTDLAWGAGVLAIRPMLRITPGMHAGKPTKVIRMPY